MKTQIINRKDKEKYTEKSPLPATILYKTIIGGVVLAFATRKTVSKVSSIYMNSKSSVKRIDKFIKKNKINMDDYPKREYLSFNDFFTRKILKNKRPFSKKQDDLISVADSKLLVYEINDKTEMIIKNKKYTLKELLRDKNLAGEYKGGLCLVFRLTVDDYHRYSFVDDGNVIKTKKINGILHTVGPIAFRRYKVFKENQREYSVLNTKNFGKVIQMEVGALMVGKIVNYNIEKFHRGDEKGYFLFGGSTVVLILKKDTVKIDEDILKNSAVGIETKVKLGETIGKRK
ncbi:MAG: phosphatidylserine decarboxylase [Bacilli bacterium]